MSIIAKLKQQFTTKDIKEQKALKLAQTERFLSAHRQTYRASQPIGFKSRSEGAYHLAMRTHN